MKIKSCIGLALFVATVGVAVGLGAQQPAAAADSVSKAVMPQIVRLSYVQGDVRVSRGKTGRHEDGSGWEQAVVNLPLATGFSVVTGKGRAEIEFEDASTMYLGEDSVLVLNDLTSKEDVPHTEMALLTGVATLHLKPEMPGEIYFFKTPTDTMHVAYGIFADMRVNSYLDAVTLTPVWFPSSHPAGAQRVSAPVGASVTFSYGVRQLTSAHPAAGNVSEWDQWVAQRVETRAAAMSEVMGEAGLDKPLPGLADMKAKGRFFRCEPYGTCWEPTNGWERQGTGGAQGTGGEGGGAASRARLLNVAGQASGQQASAQQATAQQATSQDAPTVQASTPQDGGHQATGAADPTQQSGAGTQVGAQTPPQTQQSSGGYGSVPTEYLYDGGGFDFPCSPFGAMNYMGEAQDFTAADDDFFYNAEFANGFSFNWAACNAGSWIQRGGRYAWVVQRGRQPHSPVHWVVVKGKLGFVPIHPADVAGKAPLNLKHGVYVEGGRKGVSFVRQGYATGESMKMLKSTPKQFREPAFPAMAAVKAPVVQAKVWAETLPGAKGLGAQRPVNTIAFDRRSQSFSLVTRVTEGGRSNTFSQPMGSRVGTSQMSGPMLAGGYRGGSGGAMASGGSGGQAENGYSSGGGRGGFGGGSISGSRGGSVGGGTMGGGTGMSGGGGMSSRGGASSGGSSMSSGSGGGHPR